MTAHNCLKGLHIVAHFVDAICRTLAQYWSNFKKLLSPLVRHKNMEKRLKNKSVCLKVYLLSILSCSLYFLTMTMQACVCVCSSRNLTSLLVWFLLDWHTIPLFGYWTSEWFENTLLIVLWSVSDKRSRNQLKKHVLLPFLGRPKSGLLKSLIYKIHRRPVCTISALILLKSW